MAALSTLYNKLHIFYDTINNIFNGNKLENSHYLKTMLHRVILLLNVNGVCYWRESKTHCFVLINF